MSYPKAFVIVLQDMWHAIPGMLVLVGVISVLLLLDLTRNLIKSYKKRHYVYRLNNRSKHTWLERQRAAKRLPLQPASGWVNENLANLGARRPVLVGGAILVNLRQKTPKSLSRLLPSVRHAERLN